MCHHSSFLLYESLENPTQNRWNKITHVSVGTSCLIILLFGISGYATFTVFSQGDLLENYCMSDDLANIARILFAITIMLTYPIECFVVREVNIIFV
jgi:sodium-coupled neutral amino acid transporter 11